MRFAEKPEDEKEEGQGAAPQLEHPAERSCGELAASL
jgi:hypothetical protein